MVRFCRQVVCRVSLALAVATAWCQTAQLRGLVTDPTGAIIPAARVSLTAADGRSRTAAAANDGTYMFTGLATGDYQLQATAPNMTMAEPLAVTIRPGLQTVNLQLQVARSSQQVSVEENAGPAVATDPASNATALVLSGDDLQALADNPEDLATDLAALAGPSAGPGGGAIFIDGFSGGDLPSKDSIREVRINQNPFAPEYDKLGLGRIEIFTKPGSDQFKGQAYYNLGDSVWNSRNPYAAEKAPFLLKEYGVNFGGPLRQRASYTMNIERHAIDNGAVINGSWLDPAILAIVDPYTAVLRIPQRRIIVSSRLDYRLGDNHTLAARYVYIHAGIDDSGVGSFNLPERAVHAQSVSHTGQLTETAVLGAAVNETRFQFYHLDTSNQPAARDPAIQVLGAFNGGGSIVGDSSNTQNNYELQNYTSWMRGTHAVKFGARLREQTVDDVARQNFNGTFTFSGGLAPSLDASGQMIQITSIESYRRTLLFANLPPDQIRALGGGASQFSITGGMPAVSARQFDAGVFAGDDWRARANLTLSFGLRYEAQTNIHDWRDFAPRVAVAWAPGAKSAKTAAKTVIRAGFGMFYDRFALVNSITALRYNGLVQQQYVIDTPSFFPVVPPLATLASQPVTTQRVATDLRAPYLMQSSIGIERQLFRNTTVAVTYANTHGLHQLRSAVLHGPGPVYLMESSGLYNQNQMIANVNTRVSKKISLFGSYTYNRALSNTDDLSTFRANPYSDAGEYGPAATDIRHRVSAGGSIETWGRIRLSPLLNLNSGPPFDITLGRDFYGDTLFNARPGLAMGPCARPLVATHCLDPNPAPGEPIVSRNFGRGPGAILFNLRVARAFAFGPVRPPADGKGAGDHRFNLNLSLAIRNLINHNNPGPIIGNITSPLFGQANQPAGAANLGGTGFSESANNRRLEFQARFSF
jgi:hypothetical protein